MSWFNKIQRRLEPYAITNLTLYLVIGQTFVYLTDMLGLMDVSKCLFRPDLVTHGEPWRVLTFIFIPPGSSPWFIAFVLYLFYLFGTSLEHYWGTLHYNLFLLTGYLLTVGVAFLTPYAVATNFFVGGAVILAFAYLNPDFVIYIFLILPLKAKWLGVLTWFGCAWTFFNGNWATRFSVIAGVGNFLIFFASDIWLSLRHGRRRMQVQAQRATLSRDAAQPRHICHVCGKTDITNPELDFRYCSKCAGDQCYCPEHIRVHEHVLTDPDAKS
jgi:hypothetical protein